MTQGKKLQTFHIRVNDGPEQTIEVASSIYELAAAAVPALLDLTLPVEIDIWVPDLSRFRFRIRDNEYGHMVVDHLVKVRSDGEKRDSDAKV
jgi:hypothetical protein